MNVIQTVFERSRWTSRNPNQHVTYENVLCLLGPNVIELNIDEIECRGDENGRENL